MTFLGVDHFALYVEDLDRSVEWYTRALGFQLTRRTDDLARVSHDSGLSIVLRAAQGSAPGSAPGSGPAAAPGSAAVRAPAQGQGLDHVALRVADLEELDRWASALGAEVHSASNGSTVDVHDPDGLEIELFVPAERGS